MAWDAIPEEAWTGSALGYGLLLVPSRVPWGQDFSAKWGYVFKDKLADTFALPVISLGHIAIPQLLLIFPEMALP